MKAQCHCGTSTFCVKFDRSTLPFDNSLCHCNTCRHVTGQMAFYYLPIQGLPLVGSLGLRPVDPNSSDLTGYRTSSRAVRYFCATCSSHLFKCIDETVWYVSSGILDNVEGLARLRSHVWVKDTMDGGMANQLREVAGHRLPRFAQAEGSKELPLNWRSENLPSKEEMKKAEGLDGYCHCGAVRFTVTRPNIYSIMPQAPYPDLLMPTSLKPLAKIRNSKDEKWWLYLAGHCVCTSCRLGSGAEVQSWAFLSRANVFEAGSTQPIELRYEDDRHGSLSRYTWSPGKYREFCSTCGATVFLWHTGRPDIFVISAGLFDQQTNGARAEEWLKWHKERLSYLENARPSGGIIQGLVEGMATEPEMDHHLGL
ncbi:Mss4-like protein [Pholiota molesta]|nr:Mss4-like protein [Pholiota molesta]